MSEVSGTSKGRRVVKRTLDGRANSAMQTGIDARIATYASQLATYGSSVEKAIAAAMSASDLTKEQRDIYRGPLTDLARKYAQPEERILGVHAVIDEIPQYYRPRGSSGIFTDQSIYKLGGLVVVLTNGFAVKSKSTKFRVDYNEFDDGQNTDWPEVWSPYTQQPTSLEDFQCTLRVSLKLGDLEIVQAESFHLAQISTSALWAACWLQENPDFFDDGEQVVDGVGTMNATQLPQSRLIRNWRDAEIVVAEWMTYWGFHNVSITGPGADGGIDVRTDEAVVQVKAEGSPSGRPKVQQLHGVAVSESKTAIFFALAGFTPGAKKYAEENSIGLFSFDLQGIPRAENADASKLAARFK